MRISKNPFFSLPKSGLFSNGSQRGFFNFFEKKDTFIDPKKKKLRKATISDYLVPGLVVISWILIFKLWWGAEEVCKKQYEKLAQQDATAYRTVFEKKEHVKNEVPEEFRSEYIEKQKRRMAAIIKQKREAESAILKANGLAEKKGN